MWITPPNPESRSVAEFCGIQRIGAALAVLVIASCLAGCPGQVSSIPDRTVVLTFDDGLRSHLTLVAPVLREYGFGATFFITGQWRNEYATHLAFEEIIALEEMGFEIGSHSFGHLDCSAPRMVPYIAEDLDKLDLMLTRVGIGKPTTFAWPGDRFGRKARKILLARGIRFARRGAIPELPAGVHGLGPLYDPREHDPLLIPTTVTVGPQTTMADLRQAVALAHDGKAAVIQFHGVPDPVNTASSTSPRLFREFLDLLRDKGCNVISLGDLAQWVDPALHPDDDITMARVH